MTFTQLLRSLKNGSYYFTNASGHTYAVYCHMDEVPGCGAGGWTLVMKTDGSKVRCAVILAWRLGLDLKPGVF